MAEIPLNAVPYDLPDEPTSTLSPKDGKAFSSVPIPLSGGAPICRMRGYDTTLARLVFWWSETIDPDGNSYSGPGPLTDVVLFNLLGT